MKSFCTRPSRLLSGDPSALFAQDSDFFSLSDGPLGLASPFQFQLDTIQAADTQQWHVPLIQLSIFNPTSTLAINLDLIKLMLMPNNLVGSIAQADDGTIQTQNSGIEIESTGSDLINAASSGWQALFYRVPLEVPPKWFIRLAIYDDGSGTVLPADSIITLRAQRQLHPYGLFHAMNSFCTRPSRLLSGSPDALFAQDSGRFTTGDILSAALSSPFRYQLDTQQCPYTKQWHLNLLRVVIYSIQGLANLETGPNAVRLFLCPNANVGAQFTNGGIPNINPQNVGIELHKSRAISEVDAFPQGYVTFYFGDGPVDIPPGWFLRLCILDGNSGPNFLRAGDSIVIDSFRSIVPVKFAEGN